MRALPAFDRAAVESHIFLLHDLASGVDGVLILAAFEERGVAQVQRFTIGDAAGMTETIMGFEKSPKNKPVRALGCHAARPRTRQERRRG